jgi:hypothetical protein
MRGIAGIRLMLTVVTPKSPAEEPPAEEASQMASMGQSIPVAGTDLTAGWQQTNLGASRMRSDWPVAPFRLLEDC